MGLIDQAFGLFERHGAPRAARLSLALQGGGSFGAFTWGVLERLLEEEQLELDSISGASAGAVNAVLLASGLAEAGREGARKKLQKFWKRMSDAAAFLPPTVFPVGIGALARALSPYHFNPFDLNPLRSALASEVDFERLNTASDVRLLVAATRVADGTLRIFRNGELSVDAVLASACLPTIHRTIEIEGEAYWDGGYVANPPLIQLVHESDADEILIVQVTPNRVAQTPVTLREIEKRLSQVAFNAPLNAEVEALKLAANLGATPKLRQLRVARIAAEDEIDDLARRDAANLGWTFLESLRAAGRQAAQTWLEERIEAA